jgi:(4-O-methyl)-D-glucuronate---lignin esterase
VGAAVGLSIAGGPAEAASVSTPSPFPEVPTADITPAEDRLQMLWQLGIPVPELPPRAQDPSRPPNAVPVDPADTEGNWTDPLGHTVVRGGFGQWITYDDSAGPAGGAVSPAGPFGVGSSPRYPDIELLRMNDGTPVRTPEDWWTRRRPEIFRDVQECLYGYIPPRELWPEITWSVGPVTTGTANGVPYRERVITGAIDVSGHPSVRNRPMVQGTLRTPLPAGTPVPVIIVFGGNNGEWRFTAPHGMGVCAFNWSALQPDRGGADMSSWIIGLINKGRWRRPRDWGALAAWSWGVSRLIDFFETDPDVDATRIGVQGHSRFGKATLVCAAYDERVGAAFPSAAGALGTSWARMTWGENLELVCGADTEYHWVNGAIMRFAGGRRPGRYWPRKVWDLPVDAHSVMSLIAPRVVMTSGGTDIPPGFGDAWTNPRGMYLAGAVSSQVWEHLGWPGQIIPPGTVFTSGPGEAPGGTPPIDVAFIEGTVGWRRHHEGHTPVPDWPSFMELTARHFLDDRPVVTPGQRFRLGAARPGSAGTVRATDGDGDPLGNWQITGGSGAGMFTIDAATGEIRVARRLGPRHAGRYTLAVTVDDRKLTSHRETVVIDVPEGHTIGRDT